ncbi:hypothetical protein EJ08DRAFT_653658 [Tothia fuscella]|uniref:Methyltransferase type 11 domain-containing protein n=1 Tax=Tothia fuscella TaxID=1048955 RepID=A0A9P4NH47_9PEZI|nr:hypothetical protein EJ08DRAFT_653658 [Tothia fuscella]
MITAANDKFASAGDVDCAFVEHDCTRFSTEAGAKYLDGKWDKVFSNAALHWILRDPSTRMDVFKEAHDALKPGGMFVFEMSGHGNVAEVHEALIAALITQGMSAKEANNLSPWFFPSTEWIQVALQKTGFEVEKVEIEYRPTKLTTRDAGGEGGLSGWVRLMGAKFLEVLDEVKREEVIRFVIDILDSLITREEDHSQWLGYIRLRAVARKSRP